MARWRVFVPVLKSKAIVRADRKSGSPYLGWYYLQDLVTADDEAGAVMAATARLPEGLTIKPDVYWPVTMETGEARFP